MLDSSRSAALSEDSPEVRRAAAVLRRGGIIVYPTETFYGLGADALCADAVARLVRLKKRPPDKPVAVLVSGIAMLDAVVESVPPAAAALMRRFWPGPLTLVLPARRSVSIALTAGSGSIGVRWSSHPLATAIVAALGRPLTTPSANPAGAEPPTVLEQAQEYLGDGVDLYVDGGVLAGGAGSTVVDPGPPLRILRPGVITAEALAEEG